MSGFLFGNAGGKQSNQGPQYSSLRVQTSVAGKAVAIVYGQIRISGNLIWYGNFEAIANSSGGGGKGGGKGGGNGGANVNYTYQAGVAIALCEGPMAAIDQLWDDKTAATLAAYNFTPFLGSYAQSAWGYLQSGSAAIPEQHTIPATGPYTVTVDYTAPFIADDGVAGPSGLAFTAVGSAPAINQYVINASTGTYTFNAANAGETVTISYTAGNQQPANAALNYRGLAYAAAGPLQLGNSAELPNFGFEICSPLAFQVSPLAEAHTIPSSAPYRFQVTYGPQQVVGGVGVPGTGFLYDLGVSAGGTAYTQVASAPGPGQYAVDDAGDYTFNAADAGVAVTVNYASSTSGQPADADPAAVITDYLTNPYYGLGFPLENIGDLTMFSSYCRAAGLLISDALVDQQAASDYLKSLTDATNSEFVWSSGQLSIVPYGDAGSVSGNGSSFTPAAAAQFTFTDDDYLTNQNGGSSGVTVTDKGGKYDPVLVNRTRPADAYNDIKVEYLDRTNAYNPAIVEWKDDAAITAYGLRSQDTKTFHFFCAATAANQAVALQGARQQVRNTYTFTVGLKYCQLDPMDLVAINDSNLGLADHLCLVTEITENYDKDFGQSLTIVAEDYFNAGNAAITPYGHQPNSGYVPNYNQDPGDANAPVIFTYPVEIAPNGSLEVGIAVSGSGSVWAGAQIWVSTDGNTYKQAGTVEGPARQGVLTAVLPLGTDPDTTDTLSVDLTESSAVLLSGTQADADSYATLCYCDGELISYETATLTGPNAYNLIYLRRGAYGTTIAAHASGTLFARLDNAIFDYPFSKDQIGTTIYVKLLSFNLWGGALQQLDEVSASTFTLQGPPLPIAVTGLSATQSGDTVLIAWTDLPASYALKGYDIRYGAQGGTVASAKLVTEASRATSESTVSIPPGNWTIYIQAHDIAEQLGPAASVNLSVINANIPVIDFLAAPDWLGTLAGFVLHYTGVLIPDSTVLASALTNAQLFESFVPDPVSNPTYTTPTQDVGFNDTLRVFFSDAGKPGPGVVGSTAMTFSLDSWQTGQSDPNTYASWPAAANVDAEFFKGRLVQNTAVPSVVTQFTMTGDVPAASVETVTGVAVGATGTTVSFATLGIGPFHSAPFVQASPGDGVLTGAGASSVTATGCFLQGFVGSTLTAGTVTLLVSGS